MVRFGTIVYFLLLLPTFFNHSFMPSLLLLEGLSFYNFVREDKKSTVELSGTLPYLMIG